MQFFVFTRLFSCGGRLDFILQSAHGPAPGTVPHTDKTASRAACSRSLFCHMPGSSGSGHASPDFDGPKCRDFKKLQIVFWSLRLLYRGYLKLIISSQEILKMVNDGLSRFLLGIISTANFERLLFGLTCSFFCLRPLQLIQPFPISRASLNDKCVNHDKYIAIVIMANVNFWITFSRVTS